MYHLLSTNGGAAAIKKKVKGAVTKTIRKDALREIQMPIPPVGLQTEFCKVISKQSILLKHNDDLKNEYEANFNALMQKAFKGELKLDKADA
jgi:type I restriction enzyme S subunit